MIKNKTLYSSFRSFFINVFILVSFLYVNKAFSVGVYPSNQTYCSDILRVTINDGDCDRNDDNSIKYEVGNPGVCVRYSGSTKEPTLKYPNASGCQLKSCEDLTTEEFRAIYYAMYSFAPDQEPSGGESPRSPNYQKFCQPYKYDVNQQNEKYFNPINLNDKIIFCHEFTDKNVLKYLVRERSLIDTEGRIINDIFHCRLHECPIPETSSMSCRTNYYIFYDKNAQGNRIRNSDYLGDYEKYILRNNSYEKATDSNAIRSLYCTSIGNCTKSKISALVNCAEGCDEYIGLDTDLKRTVSPDTTPTLTLDEYNQITNIYSSAQVCGADSPDMCYKTTDCGITNNSNSQVCKNLIQTELQTYDETLSYFYRPTPHVKATETLYVDKSLLNYTDDTLGKTIYSGSFVNNNSADKVPIRVIKRLLVGKPDYPFTPDEPTPAPEVFGGHWVKYSPKGAYLRNYFRNKSSGLDLTRDRNNVCANGQDEFKYYDLSVVFDRFFWITGEAWYGENYNGHWGVTKIGTVPHILPLCDAAEWGIPGAGRTYTCGNIGWVCNAPNWDSYYFRGNPQYVTKANEPDMDSFTATLCLRFKNSGELGVCGNRECRVDCAFSICAVQWCGNDQCANLTLRNGEDCSLAAFNGQDDLIINGRASGCYKNFTSGLAGDQMRFRLNRVGNKVYGFLDAVFTLCNKAGKDTLAYQQSTYESWGETSFRGKSRDTNIRDGSYRGRMDEYSLLDDNSLTNHNGDEYISDVDIFGEALTSKYNCRPDEIEYVGHHFREHGDPICSKLRAYNGSEGNGWWLTWDIVQYIGNNQPQYNDNCKVGQIKNCRGFYDKDGTFYDEQQGVVFPLPISPDLFYKYATINTTPDLFLPLLIITKYWNNNGVPIELYPETLNDSILLDYFVPRIEVSYGISYKNASLTISQTEMQDSIKTEFRVANRNPVDLEAIYKFKKTAQLYPEPKARACLTQVLADGSEKLIKCLNRDNPKISNLLIKPGNFNTSNPYIFAYLHNQNLSGISSGTVVPDINNENKFLPLYNNPDLLDNNYKKLYFNEWAYSQKYPVFLEASYCSKLHYECVTNRKKLIDEYEKGEAAVQEIINTLSNKIRTCENEIDTNCDSMSGSNVIVQKIQNGIPYIVKMKENYNTDSGYNQMCITKGFEKYSEEYVYAIPSTNLVLGKCNLIDDSKKNANCRRSSYNAFCTQRGVNGCECLDGTSTCNCSTGNNCTRVVNCSCSGDACLSLPNECFLPGINFYKTIIDKDNQMTESCFCEVLLPGQSHEIKSGFEVRKITPRELGLCVGLRNMNFCDAVKYYNKNKVYSDGGEGKNLSYITNNKISNIWRTEQKMYGKYYQGDLGNAEFDLANDCSNFTQEESNEFCLLRNRCYNQATGRTCTNPGKDCSNPLVSCTEDERNCRCELLQPGECVGFWKNKENTIPLARCTSQVEGNETYTNFSLIPKTGCERYSCPKVDEYNVVVDSELIRTDLAEISTQTTNPRGLFNGFALWDAYKKGTLDLTTRTIRTDGIENGHGDDIEEIIAAKCIQGYGPAGANYILRTYLPYVKSASSLDNILSKQDELIRLMFAYNQPLPGDTIFADYSTKMSYNSKHHFPVRYCNQIGEWMPVNDLYTRFKYDLYYITNPNIHNLNEVGLVQVVSSDPPLTENNTYGDTIKYSERYCERLYCNKFEANDIGLLSVEASNPSPTSEQSYLNGGVDNKYYPIIPGPLNYPKDPTNYSDLRTNKVVNNRNTPWRHTGGATWPEVPAPRTGTRTENISGTCQENKNFYPFDTVFIPSFQEQYNLLFAPGDSNPTANLKTNSLKVAGSPATQPERICSKWGVWGEIANKCVATCEPLDVFRTTFADTNVDSLLQNHEITLLLRVPAYRSSYIKNPSAEVKEGDIYTGGAKWGRTKAGYKAIGECDATIGKNHSFPTFPESTKLTGIQFLRNGTSVNITDGDGSILTTEGKPYRECLADGTWGPISDSCVNFMTCPDKTLTNNMIASGTVAVSQNVTTLNGGSINYSQASAGGPGTYQIPVSANCNSNNSFESGTVSQKCDVTTGNWTGSLTIGCNLKTCGARTDYTDTNNTNVIINIAAGMYYPKSSGYEGAITLNSKTYSGYKTTASCPSGYVCSNCQNNVVSYTCDFDANGVLNWQRQGDCVPLTCSNSSLTTNCNSTTGCTRPLPPAIKSDKPPTNTVVFPNGARYDATTSSYTNGTYVELSCGTGYYDAPSSDLHAHCEANGQWSIIGSCIRVCDKVSLQSSGDNIISTTPGVPGSKFYPSYSNATTFGTVYENGRYFADNAIIEANCATGYLEVLTGGELPQDPSVTHAYKCINGVWKRLGTCTLSGCWVGNSGVINFSSAPSPIKVMVWGSNGADGGRGENGGGSYGGGGGAAGFVSGTYGYSNVKRLDINYISGGSGGDRGYGKTGGSCTVSGAGGDGGRGYRIIDATNSLYVAIAGGGGGGGGGGGTGCCGGGNNGFAAANAVTSLYPFTIGGYATSGGNGTASDCMSYPFTTSCGGGGGGGGGGAGITFDGINYVGASGGGTGYNHYGCYFSDGGSGGGGGYNFAGNLTNGANTVVSSTGSYRVKICWGANNECSNNSSPINSIGNCLTGNQNL